MWKERNKRMFNRVKEDIDNVRVRWFQTPRIFFKGQPLYSIEDFDDLIDILVDM